MLLSYPKAFELPVELHIAKFTGRNLSRVSVVQVFSYEFCKTFKNICFEEYLKAELPPDCCLSKDLKIYENQPPPQTSKIFSKLIIKTTE